MLECIQHPQFIRISKTEYAVRDPNSPYRGLLHVSQIMKYLAFDELLRKGKNLSTGNCSGIPLGYTEFATIFNNGAHPQDKRRLSTYTLSQTGNRCQWHIVRSPNPVSLHDFRITPEQCGIDSPNRSLADARASVFEEYAITMANRNKRRREAIQERKAKRGVFGKSSSSHAPTSHSSSAPPVLPSEASNNDNLNSSHELETTEEMQEEM